ncbi:hypothetical protein Tco_0335881 [Tanacetum coccineum]
MKQKRRQGKNVTAIDNYEIAHYCEKMEKKVSEEAAAVLVCSATIMNAKQVLEQKRRSLEKQVKTTALSKPSSLNTNVYQENCTFAYKKFPTHEEALVDPPSIELPDWVQLCDKFASEKFQKLSEQNKKNRSLSLIPPVVGTKSVARRIDINNLQSEDAAGSGTPAEICFKVLKRVPGHLRERSAPKKEILAVENLRTIVELERNKSEALEEKLKEVVVEQDEMKKCMGLMMKGIQCLSKLVPHRSVEFHVSSLENLLGGS